MLKLHNLTEIYASSTQEVHALNDVNISFYPAEFIAILGPSRCVKTTLLNIIILILGVFISAAIYCIFGAKNIVALPWVHAFILISISVLLTFVADFISARLTAKKDTVEALRFE